MYNIVQSSEPMKIQHAKPLPKIACLRPCFAGFDGDQHVTRSLIWGRTQWLRVILNNSDWYLLEACVMFELVLPHVHEMHADQKAVNCSCISH